MNKIVEFGPDDYSMRVAMRAGDLRVAQMGEVGYPITFFGVELWSAAFGSQNKIILRYFDKEKAETVYQDAVRAMEGNHELQ